MESDKLSDVYSFLQLRDGNILCGCWNGKICIYDIKLNIISFKKNRIHRTYIRSLLNINKYQFISCSHGETSKVWEY